MLPAIKSTIQNDRFGLPCRAYVVDVDCGGSNTSVGVWKSMKVDVRRVAHAHLPFLQLSDRENGGNAVPELTKTGRDLVAIHYATLTSAESRYSRGNALDAQTSTCSNAEMIYTMCNIQLSFIVFING